MSRQPPPGTLTPGLQYPTLPESTTQIRDVMKNIYDNLFFLRKLVKQPAVLDQSQLGALASQIAEDITTNITNNTTIIGGLFLVGTHQNRLVTYGTASEPIGTAYFETDRNVIYIITDTPKKWEFAAGLMLGDIADRPSDLSTHDASFLFCATNTRILYFWDGSSWLTISTDVQSAGYWAPVSNGIPDAPEIIFDSFADVVVAFTPTP